ncbi:hypothetical protein CPB84DRAFT_1783679 [Gymnopilus junonius]|uniref:SCP domain-containing protein n=1 Tax=Gymnopilus junonius TaxID=109634 RepID=A0A9P5NM26_GYMJU|nr:hypothetical protein CPB84DRAFT_1783679 [Gymnopilus junonius]
MKFSICLTLLPFLASFCVSAVAAYPVYGSQRAELVARQELETALLSYLERRTNEEKEKKPSLLKSILHPPKLTEEEKAAKARFNEGRKLNIKAGKEIAKEAKKEGRKGVDVTFVGPNHAEHIKNANKLAQKNWKSTKNFQQYTHAEVAASKLKSGRTNYSIRYHKNDGNVGAYTNAIVD